MSASVTRRDRVVAVLLFAATFTLLWSTEASVGYPRDESVYFAAGRIYAEWMASLVSHPADALSDTSIVRAYGFNREHPVLFKNLFGLSHRLLHASLGWVRPATALRVPAFAASALIPSLLYLLGLLGFGRAAGLFAAAAFFAVPRHFFHGHIAAFDLPITTLWLLTVYAFLRAQHSRNWAVACGVAFGLALATKHNAFFLPVVLAPFALWRAWTEARGVREARLVLSHVLGIFAGAGLLMGGLVLAWGADELLARVEPLSAPVAVTVVAALLLGERYRQLQRCAPGSAAAVRPLLTMALLGPLVLYLHWPLLWHHPVERVSDWLAFHAHHEHYAWLYLGELLREPPFPLAYVVVVTALTVPLSLLVPTLLGVTGLVTRPRTLSFEEGVVLVNAVASIALISHPEVPHFGGVKHWFPSMPFLLLLAGASVQRAGQAASAATGHLGLPRHLATALLSLTLLAPAIIATARVHPYGTASYSELAGGIPGAASLGMQRQFWSSHVTGVLPWINTHARRGARVWLHEVTGLTFRDYQENGQLRADLVAVDGPEAADIAAYQWHLEFREQEFRIWDELATDRPVAGLYVDETPQVMVYARPRSAGD